MGVVFIEVLRDTMKALGDHLSEQDGSAVAPGPGLGLVGNPNAFAQFVRGAYKKLPRDASSLVI